MAEIELAALCEQCLGNRRFPGEESLRKEILAWEEERNERGIGIRSRFTVEKALDKFRRLYVKELS